MEHERATPTQTRVVETPVEARQGFLDRPVLLVLVVSIALVVIAFGALWLPTVL